MKSLIIFMMCFSLAIPGYSKSPVRKPASTYKLEKGKFSSLFLTRDQIASLSPEDRTVYIASIITLANILEGSQDDVMEKIDELKPSKETQTSKLNLFWELSESKANAVLPAIIGAGAWALRGLSLIPVVKPVVQGSARYLTRKSVTYSASAVKSSASTASTVVSTSAKGVRTGEITAAAFNNAKAAETALSKTLKAYKKDIANLSKVGKKPTVADKALVARAQATLNKLKADTAKFVAKGRTPAERKALAEAAATAMKNQGISRLIKTPVGLMTTAGTLWGGYELYKWIEGDGGETPQDVANRNAATALAFRPSAESKGTLTKEAGQSCLFGGHPSNWKGFGGGTVKCTRPEASQNENCHGSDFQCPTHGIEANDETLTADLCMRGTGGDWGHITKQCSEKLMLELDKRKLAVGPDEWMKFQVAVQEHVIGLESAPRMISEDGKTKSISGYCSEAAGIQAEECDALYGVVKGLKSTEAASMIAENQRVTEEASEQKAGGERATN